MQGYWWSARFFCFFQFFPFFDSSNDHTFLLREIAKAYPFKLDQLKLVRFLVVCFHKKTLNGLKRLFFNTRFTMI